MELVEQIGRRVVPGRKWCVGLAALSVGVLLAGCTMDGSTSDAAAPAAGVTADQEHPLALFLGEDLGLIDYAQLKLQSQCMAKAGYPQTLDTMLGAPRPAFEGLVVTPRTFGPTTEQEARRIGFGQDLPAEPPAVVSSDPNFDRAVEDCSGKAWQQLGDGVQRTYTAYFDLGNKLSGSLMKTISARLEQQLPGKMLSCIRGKGYQPTDEAAFLKTPRPQLLGVRFAAPDPGAGASWTPKKVPGTVEVGPAVPAREYHATPEEGALAVAWLQCRRETGMAGQQMATAIAVQKELAAKYETSFDELNPEIRRAAKQAAALIGAR